MIIIGIIAVVLALIYVFILPSIRLQGEVAKSELKLIEAQEELQKTKDDAKKQLCDEAAKKSVEADLKGRKVSQADKNALINAYKTGCYNQER